MKANDYLHIGRENEIRAIARTDPNGVLNMSTPLPVTVSVEGAGIHQGFVSADQISTEIFFDAAQTTFDGKVLAVVRTLQETGKVRVNVTAPGCESRVSVTAPGCESWVSVMAPGCEPRVVLLSVV